jgi:hypothetical protein
MVHVIDGFGLDCRILYIKADTMVKFWIGEKNLFRIFLIVGMALNVYISLVFVQHDDQGSIL